jgi:V8-like Glu-specific endopeptidase
VILFNLLFRHKAAEGTGFLLGADVVMTNYHVIEAVIKGQLKPYDVVLRFDYKAASQKEFAGMKAAIKRRKLF